MDATVNKFGIGQPVRRVEDQRFITGLGSYVDDIALPRQCYGVVVMSLHAHARIVSIDTAKAAAADGVLCILTGKDAAADGIGTLMNPMPEDVGGPKGYRARRPLLAADKVRAVGDRVAFVVAETLRQAQDAAELIAVEYETLPAVTSVDDAVKSGAPAVWDDNPGNVAFALAFGNKDATELAFAMAPHTVALRLESNRLSANSIEPRAAIGDYNAADDAYTLYATSQNPGRVYGDTSMTEPSTSNSGSDVVAPEEGTRPEGEEEVIVPEEVAAVPAPSTPETPVSPPAESDGVVVDDGTDEGTPASPPTVVGTIDPDLLRDPSGTLDGAVLPAPPLVTLPPAVSCDEKSFAFVSKRDGRSNVHFAREFHR